MATAAISFETTIVPAIHEAGHAVVAAYLRCPFTHVTIRCRTLNGTEAGGYLRHKESGVHDLSYNRKTGSFRLKTDEEIQAELKRQYRNRALVAVGARAAVDEILGRNCRDNIEDSYGPDEVDLKAITELLEIASEFEEWRAQILEEARSVVRLPFVRDAISDIAADLQIALIKGRGLSAKRVRDVLKACKTAYDERIGISTKNRAI